jgi:hypothetical protein
MSTLTAQLRRRRLAAIGAGAAAVAVLLGPAAGVASAGGRTVSGGIWGTAIEVPGTGLGGETLSVSCASAGNCSAGGFDAPNSSQIQAFVVSQVNGKWGTARQIAGGLNTGGAAQVNSVSCASAGNCSAGGEYSDSSGGQAFVVSQVNGKWGTARQIAGGLNTGGAEIDLVSCASAGNCSAGGAYTDSSGHGQAFVVSQVNGKWGTARQIAGGLNTGSAAIGSLSCASAGNCGAGGFYADSSGHQQAFADSQVNGKWGTAIEVPGTATLNTGGVAAIGPYSCNFSCSTDTGMSCASAGNCSAGGFYDDSSGFQAFVVREVNGKWGTAREVPGTATLNTGGGAGIESVSCASAGNCSAGGLFTDSSGHQQAFAVSQVNGKWGTAIEVPGTAALNTGRDATIFSVSCASAGKCSAGGTYTSSVEQAFVVSQT